MGQVVWLSLVTASVAFTLCETTVFAGLRDWLKGRSVLLGKLAGCGYCLGHWVAFGLVAIYRPRHFGGWRFLDYLLTAVVIAWLAAFQWTALCCLLGRQENSPFERRRELAERWCGLPGGRRLTVVCRPSRDSHSESR